jgi:hypothetical protein
MARSRDDHDLGRRDNGCTHENDGRLRIRYRSFVVDCLANSAVA